MKKIIPLFLFALFFSCTAIEDAPVNVPENILPKEKMAEVMVDVHLLEATLNMNAFSKDNVVINNASPTSDILKENGITKAKYDESFAFYTRNPKLLAEVYQLVLNDLSKRQAEVATGK